MLTYLTYIMLNSVQPSGWIANYVEQISPNNFVVIRPFSKQDDLNKPKRHV